MNTMETRGAPPRLTPAEKARWGVAVAAWIPAALVEATLRTTWAARAACVALAIALGLGALRLLRHADKREARTFARRWAEHAATVAAVGLGAVILGGTFLWMAAVLGAGAMKVGHMVTAP
jgi:hypothetical protein